MSLFGQEIRVHIETGFWLVRRRWKKVCGKDAICVFLIRENDFATPSLSLWTAKWTFIRIFRSREGAQSC